MEDINVYENTEDVTINVTQEVIEVNINKVIGGGSGTWGYIIGDIAEQLDLQDSLDLKVDKVAGKELSENDFTDVLKTKLDGIEAGAEVNVNADWDSVSGDSEILNKPSIPSIEGLATITYVDDQDALKVDKVAGERLINATEITKLSNTSGVNTGDQDLSALATITYVDNQDDLKEDDLGNPAVDGYVLSSTVAGVRSWIEQGGAGGGTWGSITGTLSDQTDLQDALDAKVDKVAGERLINATEITKLSNTSGTNTGDETTATIQTKRPLKTIEGQSLEGSGNIDLVKADVGLANVDNTSDVNKPVSTAQQTALDLKQDTLVSGTNIKTINGSSVLGSGDLSVTGITEATLASTINGATSKATPVDADEFGITDSADSFSLKKLTWANLKATLKTYLDTLYAIIPTVNGLYVRTGAGTIAARTITGTTNRVTVTNGDGVSGNPTLTLPQDIHTAAAPQFARVGLGAAANLASYLNLIANTTTVGQIYLPPSATDYTGTLSGMLWNNTSEWKFYDGVLGSVNRFIKLNGNSILANSNPLNVVTSTGTGGNLGTLKAEVSFSRFPTATSYTILLTDVGFGWIIAVTSTDAARTITLPLANTVPAGFQLTIKDESGAALVNNITIALSGSDTTDASAINTNGGSRTVYSDGVSKWFLI